MPTATDTSNKICTDTVRDSTHQTAPNRQISRRRAMTTKPPGLVIFDCDGVLVNSEPIFNRVLFDHLQSFGATLSFEDCCRRFTGTSRHAVDHYLQQEGLAAPKGWIDAFYRDALAALQTQTEAIPGAVDAVAALTDAGLICCVASNGLQQKMEITLERTGLRDAFGDRLYSAYDLGASKPAPDVFLHAAAANGIPPAACVVIEDSPSGWLAAARAAMACLAYVPAGATHAPDAPPTDETLQGAPRFDDMSDLPALLGC
ncbi:HAD-IA family hydrolase [Phaeobacter sp.]|uniref:HAD-IA family hydrolase n=1 Tax=Phaeobacter sp. TaxID=1902409 RepID=UPI0025F2DAEF|nr:HAD-IA family hydrolase [Phaeobacter sp.]